MTNPLLKSKSRQRKLDLEQAIIWLFDSLPKFFEGVFQKIGNGSLKWLVLLMLSLSIPLIIAPLEIWQQGLASVALISIGWLSIKFEQYQNDDKISERIHLFLVWLSIVTTLRYVYYRTSYTLNFDSWLNGFCCLLLFGAELYAIMTLLVSDFQTLKLKERKPVDLSIFPQDRWFKVDIYIPTYNEDVEIVRKTAIAALAIDYPADKKRVYILDDGRKFPERRKLLAQMCEEIGCTLVTRENNDHAKAGNINNAMKKTDGDLILIFDCDHIPSRQFLQDTVGFFLQNSKVAMVQTPHWFYNPDPFERNLLTGGRTPVGNELFYKVLQKGNDYWNAAFFCGSAAVIRKDYVLKIGGIAVETVTEDCHTSFRLHCLGYETVYYDKIMVAGLAPDKFSSYVGQQVRWARGMAQILRLENPLFNWKINLTLPQRICYFAATSHFFYGFPRLIYAIAPTLFLLFGIRPIQGLGLETLTYALPHLLLALNANYIIHKYVRYSFWNEVFEFVIAFQTGIVTLMALINPKLGKFNVTDKGLQVTKRSFDWNAVVGLLIVGTVVLAALLAVPFWLLLRPEDSEAVLVNASWCVFNLILLSAAVTVAFEQPQLRKAHRLPRELSVKIHSLDQIWTGKTINISETGAQILLDSWPNLSDEAEIEIQGDFGAKVRLNARIIRGEPDKESQKLSIATEFIDLNRAQLDSLVLVIYSDVEEWYSQKREYPDDPLASFRFIATSFIRSFRDFKPVEGIKVRKKVNAFVELYWQDRSFIAYATEIGFQSVRLKLDDIELNDIEAIDREKPLVGLLFSQTPSQPPLERLLAKVETIDILGQGMEIELIFPQKLERQQEPKIKRLLETLT